MWLVLCETSDVGALWAGLGLRSRCPSVEIISTDELGSALRYDLRLDQHRRTVRIDLADGRTISSDEIDGVLNRLQRVPVGQLARAAASERSYAQAEFESLHVSWLAALDCPVINRPRPHGLCGAYRSNLEWGLLAARSGFSVDDEALTVLVSQPPGPGGSERMAQTSLVVMDDVVTGTPVPQSVAAAARRLRSLSEERLLGISLTSAEGGFRFLSATAVPDLTVGGDWFIDALAGSLRMPSVPGQHRELATR